MMKNFSSKLDTVGDYLLSLYSNGGMPLVLIGVAILIPFLPMELTQYQLWILLGFVLLLATLSWIATIYVSIHIRKIRAEQRKVILETLVEIVKKEDSATARKKAQDLQQIIIDSGLESTIPKAVKHVQTNVPDQTETEEDTSEG